MDEKITIVLTKEQRDLVTDALMIADRESKPWSKRMAKNEEKDGSIIAPFYPENR